MRLHHGDTTRHKRTTAQVQGSKEKKNTAHKESMRCEILIQGIDGMFHGKKGCLLLLLTVGLFAELFLCKRASHGSCPSQQVLEHRLGSGSGLLAKALHFYLIVHCEDVRNDLAHRLKTCWLHRPRPWQCAFVLPPPVPSTALHDLWANPPWCCLSIQMLTILQVVKC